MRTALFLGLLLLPLLPGGLRARPAAEVVLGRGPQDCDCPDTPTSTATPTATDTDSPTATFSPTASPTPSSTASPTATPTPQDPVLEAIAGLGFPVAWESDDTLLITLSDEATHFDTDKAVAKPEGVKRLRALGSVMSYFPDNRIFVSGHTDNQASHAYNVRLSLRRAKAVRGLLLAAGVNPRQFEKVEGASFDRPLVKNDNDEDRARNRRVEVRLKFKTYRVGLKGEPLAVSPTDTATPSPSRVETVSFTDTPTIPPALPLPMAAALSSAGAPPVGAVRTGVPSVPSSGPVVSPSPVGLPPAP